VAASAASLVSLSGTWACIVRLESGGNPRAVNPSSGAGGLFQFLPSTWASLGGTGRPQDASPALQFAMAQKLQARSGWSQWVTAGACGV
jgi:muramidase (phage lysozyme)